jgi:glycosyltransferase involved in cell wall biosynthesis
VPVVSVVIPARDAAGSLPATLDALAAQDLDAPYEVVVVDDGSRDATAAVARQRGAHVVTGARTGGAGRARTKGAGAAQADLLAFTDADCVPDPGWLRAGLDALRDADLVQGRVVPERSPSPLERTVSVTAAWGLFEAANLFVHRSWFERAGGFGGGLEDAGGRPFGEDVLFGWRATRAGARTAFCDTAVVRHLVEPRSLRAYLTERRRDALFPALVREVPELRSTFLVHGTFIGRRAPRLWAALGGVALALTTRRPLAAAAALPYAAQVQADVRLHGRAIAAGLVAGDAVGAAHRVAGSMRARTLVL